MWPSSLVRTPLFLFFCKPPPRHLYKMNGYLTFMSSYSTINLIFTQCFIFNVRVSLPARCSTSVNAKRSKAGRREVVTGGRGGGWFQLAGSVTVSGGLSLIHHIRERYITRGKEHYLCVTEAYQRAFALVHVGTSVPHLHTGHAWHYTVPTESVGDKKLLRPTTLGRIPPPCRLVLVALRRCWVV